MRKPHKKKKVKKYAKQTAKSATFQKLLLAISTENQNNVWYQQDTKAHIKITRSRWRLMRLRAKYVPQSQYSSKFSGYKPCESRNINFSNCHVI